MLLGTVLATMGLSAGAAVPDTAMADDDDNGGNGVSDYNPCFGGTPANTTLDVPGVGTFFVQTCTITASSGQCIQRSSKPLLIQQCFVNQGPPPFPAQPRNNNLIVNQLADQRGAEGLLDARQIVDGPPPLTRGEQRNFGTGNNVANITQRIKQKLASGIDDDDDGEDDDDNGEADEDDDGESDDDNGEENGPPELADHIEQFEQAHQWVDLCQGGVPCGTAGMAPNPTMMGRNRSVVYQSHESLAFAANAQQIDQEQNVQSRRNECSEVDPARDDEFARACYVITQHTGNTTNNRDNPANYSKLTQYSNLVENARNCDPCAGGDQGQGWSTALGGLDHSFVQDSPGIARLFSDQDEYMTQRRSDTGFMTHHQVGILRKGSGEQGTNPNSLVDILGDKDLYTGESELPVQHGEARAFAETSGECVADLFVSLNTQSGEAHEPGSDKTSTGDTCDEFVECTPSGCITSDDDIITVTALGVSNSRP